ncbi:helicase C-terminal domain-containing protein [Leptospirillum ferriphilum]|uniref:helicase C-terminal domain-containing protein n=1 Tax=Leptospirillum ferriphilum TaxID=178606 RepID=UPI001364DDAA|nr:helicase C-terminal domain-containing protein [Leptospirillum ferriphilum]
MGDAARELRLGIVPTYAGTTLNGIRSLKKELLMDDPTTKKFLDLVTEAFREGGWLSKSDYPFRKEQEQMALRIARFLPGERVPFPVTRKFDNEDGSGTIEKKVDLQVCKVLPVAAETGIGKTLAYLIPLTLFSALTGKRVAVSTFTKSLRRQVRNGRDMEIASRYAREMTGKTLAIAVRRGISNFVSLERVEALRARIEEEKPDFFKTDAGREFVKFHDWAHEGGPFDEWDLELPYGPDGNRISEDLVALRFESSEEDKAQYLDHIEEAKLADIVVTTHASVLLNAKNGWRLLGPDLDEAGRPLSVIVCDEADRLETAAKSIYSRRFRPIDVMRFLERINREDLTKKIFKKTEKFLEWMTEISVLHGNPDSLLIYDLMEGERRRIPAWVELVKKECGLIKKNLTGHFAFAASDIVSDAKAFLEVYKKSEKWPDTMIDLTWSPVRREAGIAVNYLNAGKRIHGLVYGLDRLVLTSGTLIPGIGEKAEKKFEIHYGIHESIHEPIITYRPAQFGKLEKVVFSDPNAPKPFKSEDDSDERIYNPEWVENAASMIVEAARDGRTLVLTSSFSDVEIVGMKILAKMEDPETVILHRSGEPFSRFWKKSVEGNHKVRIVLSPSPWEGENLRDRNKPWMSNLVILRLPVPPFSKSMRRHFEKLDKLYVLNDKRYRDTMRKLIQGIGRAFRSPEDMVSLWFCDPRMPLPEVFKPDYPELYRKNMELFIYRKEYAWISSIGTAIPGRFRDALSSRSYVYKNGKVLRPTQKQFIGGV